MLKTMSGMLYAQRHSLFSFLIFFYVARIRETHAPVVCDWCAATVAVALSVRAMRIVQHGKLMQIRTTHNVFRTTIRRIHLIDRSTFTLAQAALRQPASICIKHLFRFDLASSRFLLTQMCCLHIVAKVREIACQSRNSTLKIYSANLPAFCLPLLSIFAIQIPSNWPHFRF